MYICGFLRFGVETFCTWFLSSDDTVILQQLSKISALTN